LGKGNWRSRLRDGTPNSPVSCSGCEFARAVTRLTCPTDSLRAAWMYPRDKEWPRGAIEIMTTVTLRPLCTALIVLALTSCSDAPAPSTAAAPATTNSNAAAPAATAAPATTTPVAETQAQLLARANKAYAANRMIDPPEDNALDLFVRVHESDPTNVSANEALVELLPFANAAIERALATKDVAKAERVLALLERGTPESVTSKRYRLAVEKARRDADKAAAAAEAAAARTAAAVAATTSTVPGEQNATGVAPATSVPVTPSTPTASANGAADTSRATDLAVAPRPAPPSITPANTRPATTPANTAPANTIASTAPVEEILTAKPPPVTAAPPPATVASRITEPQILARVAPEYPAVARQRKVEGWVELEFIVGVDGRARDVRVIDSKPGHMFDAAALRAISRWKFKPAERDGQPEAARSRTKITFRPN
jgi:protein TonB